MRTTLGEAKALASGIVQATGLNACNPRFISLLNTAQQRLSEMGKWWGTYRRMYVCPAQGCVTWPREVATVEGMNIGGTGIRIANEWYEFGDAVRAPHRCQDEVELYDRQNVCQYAAFPWTTAKVRIYPATATDAGKTVIIQGLDTNGIPVRTLVGSTWIDGEQITLAAPFATSAFTYSNYYLTGVQKPVTNGRLNVYALNVDTADEVKVAFWEPSERNPQYRRTFLAGRRCPPIENCSGSDGCAPVPTPTCTVGLAQAIVRLEFIPALVDSDWLFIGNLLALKSGMKAVEKSDRNQYEESEAEWGTAKRILRAELDKYDPPARIEINPHPHGTARPSRIFAGFV